MAQPDPPEHDPIDPIDSLDAIDSVDPINPADPFRDFDAGYVFGALSITDRAAYEAHLMNCPTCQRAVAELAGLPGLLALVPVADVIDDATEDAPRSLLPSLLTEAARQRRRARLGTATVGLLAAACVIVALVLAIRTDGSGDRSSVAGASSANGSPTASASAAPQVPMRAVAATSLRATVGVQSVAWGTKVQMRCTYPAAGSSPGYETQDYRLQAALSDGSTKILATWTAVPGRTVQIEGDSASRRADVASVQVTDGQGDVLLELPV